MGYEDRFERQSHGGSNDQVCEEQHEDEEESEETHAESRTIKAVKVLCSC